MVCWLICWFGSAERTDRRCVTNKVKMCLSVYPGVRTRVCVCVREREGGTDISECVCVCV